MNSFFAHIEPRKLLKLGFIMLFTMLLCLTASTDAHAQEKMDNKKLQTAGKSEVYVKGKPKRSKKRRGDKKVKVKKREVRETERAKRKEQKVNPRYSKSVTKSVDQNVKPRSISSPGQVTPDRTVNPRTFKRKEGARDVRVVPRTVKRKEKAQDQTVTPRSTPSSSGQTKDVQIIPRSVKKSNVVKDIQVVPRSLKRSNVVKDVEVIPRSVKKSNTVKDVEVTPRSISKKGENAKDVKIIPRSISGERKDNSPLPQKYGPSEESKYTGKQKGGVKYSEGYLNYQGDQKQSKVGYSEEYINYKGDLKLKKKTPDQGPAKYTGDVNINKVTKFSEGHLNYQGDQKQSKQKYSEGHLNYQGDQKQSKQKYSEGHLNYQGDLKLVRKKPNMAELDYKGNMKVKKDVSKGLTKDIYAYQGEMKLKYMSNRSQHYKKATRGIDNYTGTFKDRKPRYRTHPSGQFNDNTLKNNVVRSSENKFKKFWNNIFAKKQQAPHLRDNDVKPKYDKGESEIWNY